MLSSCAHAKSSVSRLHVFVQHLLLLKKYNREDQEAQACGTLGNMGGSRKRGVSTCRTEESRWGSCHGDSWYLLILSLIFQINCSVSKAFRKCTYSQTKGLMIHFFLHVFSPLNCQSILSSNYHALCMCQRENTQCRSIVMVLSRHERRCCVLRCSFLDKMCCKMGELPELHKLSRMESWVHKNEQLFNKKQSSGFCCGYTQGLGGKGSRGMKTNVVKTSSTYFWMS